MKPRRAFWVLIQREFNVRAKQKGYWVFTLIGLVLLIGLTFLPNILQMISTASSPRILLNDPSRIVAPAVEQSLQASPKQYGFRVEMDTTPGLLNDTPAEMQDYMKNHHTRLLVLISGSSAATATFQFEQNGPVDATTLASVKSVLQQQVTAARITSLAETDQRMLSTPIQFTVNQLESNAKSADQVQQSQILVYMMLILLFATMTIYGVWVAQGIIEEKSNRIVEMMLVTCKPWEIMTGKIVGIGLVGLVQYFIWLIGAGASLYMRHQMAGLTMSQVPPATLIVLPVFYILGYFLYASLYAIAGSLVYRQEDQQMAVTPVAMIMLILFYVSIFGVLPRPDSLFSVIVSYVPLFTPLTMFARAALVGVPVWEILISIALTLAFNTALVLYGARVYRRFALRTSGQSGWRLLFQKKHVTHGSN